MFRKRGDGISIDLNSGDGYRGNLDVDERDKRMKAYWWGYWNAVRKLLNHWNRDNKNPKNGINPRVRYVFSVHSFSPVYEGQKREV
jgi:predicted N-formylglutamate amidohydrolase